MTCHFHNIIIIARTVSAVRPSSLTDNIRDTIRFCHYQSGFQFFFVCNLLCFITKLIIHKIYLASDLLVKTVEDVHKKNILKKPDGTLTKPKIY